MDITDRIIEKYKKDRGIKDTYVLNDDEMYLVDEIVQLKIGQTLPIDSVSGSFGFYEGYENGGSDATSQAINEIQKNYKPNAPQTPK
jgi:hypothetical protein